MALNSNLMIGYNDYVHKGVIYSNDTPVDPAFPLANILTENLSKPVVFAPTSPGIITFCIDLGAMKLIDLLALLKHNGNYTAKWRVYLNLDINDPLGQEYDSGWQTLIPAQSTFGALKWGQFLWGEVIPEYNLGQYNRHAYLPLPTTIGARYITVSIDAPANTNPLRFYRLWASVGYQPSVNIVYGADITVIDETKRTQAVSGTRRYGDPVQRRQLNFAFELLPRTEMLYNIVGGLHLASGTYTPVIAMLEPTDPANFHLESVYGNLMELDKAAYTSWLRWDTALKVEEAV